MGADRGPQSKALLPHDPVTDLAPKHRQASPLEALPSDLAHGRPGLLPSEHDGRLQALLFADAVDKAPDFERLAPTKFSVVVFRSVHAGLTEEELDAHNAALLEKMNAHVVENRRRFGRITTRRMNAIAERRLAEIEQAVFEKGAFAYAESPRAWSESIVD